MGEGMKQKLIDDWIKENAEDLKGEIRKHLKALENPLSDIMESVRIWHESKSNFSNKILSNKKLKQRMCGKKLHFISRKSAENYLKSIQKRGLIIPENANAYRCLYCGRWHLGHADEKKPLNHLTSK